MKNLTKSSINHYRITRSFLVNALLESAPKAADKYEREPVQAQEQVQVVQVEAFSVLRVPQQDRVMQVILSAIQSDAKH